MSEITEPTSNRHAEEINKAWAAFQNNELSKAEAIGLSLVSEFPNEFNTYYLLGHIYFEEDKTQKALEYFSLALEKDVENKWGGHLNYWIGKVYDKHHLNILDQKNPLYDYKTANKYYQKAKEYNEYPADVIHKVYYACKDDYDRVRLYTEAVEKFPTHAAFYTLAAKAYKRLNNEIKEVEIYNQAFEKEIKSPALYYNAGDHYFKKKEFSLARDFFNDALKLNEHYPQANYAINYAIGNCFYEEKDISNTEIYYRKAYENSITEDTCWFGFFGLIENYAQQERINDVQNLINEVNISESTYRFEGMITGGPFWLDSEVTESIHLSLDSKKILKSINSLKFLDKSDNFQGKVWLIKALLADHQNNNLGRFTSLKNALKYLSIYRYEFLEYGLCSSYSYLIGQKKEKKQDIKDIVKSFKDDVKTYSSSFKAAALSTTLEGLISALYDAKAYKEVIEVCDLYTIDEIGSTNKLFELGYSLYEQKDYVRAKKAYEKHIELTNHSSGALNNLGLIYKKDGDFLKAIELFKKALELSPNDEILKNNLTSTIKEFEAKEKEQNERKSLELSFKSSLKALKQENSFVLEKLNIFLISIKKDEKFNNWIVPIPAYKFPILMATDKQKAESLKAQWLTKSYIQESDRRDEHRVVIYYINPYLEAEIIRINNNKIPDNWLSGFENISIGKLEEIGYFDLIARIQKVNKKFRLLLERDFNELVFNYLVQNEKSTIVLSGSLVELVLTYHFEKKKLDPVPYTDSKGTLRNKKLYDCVLNDLIIYAENNNFYGSDFPHLSNLSRIYRNFIHPGRELKDKLDKSKCDLCFISTTEILKKIL